MQASAETLSCSTLGDWIEGTAVNLERALRVGDELGGHIVSGHVDGVARILDRRPEGELVRFVIAAPPALMPFIAPKGSVALDGVSLTVNEVDADRFGVNIIPHTLSHTGFGEARPGQRMNIEIDPLARYVARLHRRASGDHGAILQMTETTGLRAPHLLLVEAPYYAHIAAMLRDGARARRRRRRRDLRDRVGAGRVRDPGRDRVRRESRGPLRRVCRARLRDPRRDDALRPYLQRDRARVAGSDAFATASPPATAS